MKNLISRVDLKAVQFVEQFIYVLKRQMAQLNILMEICPFLVSLVVLVVAATEMFSLALYNLKSKYQFCTHFPF